MPFDALPTLFLGLGGRLNRCPAGQILRIEPPAPAPMRVGAEPDSQGDAWLGIPGAINWIGRALTVHRLPTREIKR